MNLYTVIGNLRPNNGFINNQKDTVQIYHHSL